MNSELDDRINAYFEPLIPAMGQCATLEGECLRAYSKINYRFFNDGDECFHGYGIETAGAAHAFLCEKDYLLPEHFRTIVHRPDVGSYEEWLEEIGIMLVEWIDGKNGVYTPNDQDMLECVPLFVDDEEEEEEED
jgi:hypothetical protein